MEVIDALLIFWFLLTIGVAAIGTIYEQQQAAKRRLEEKTQKKIQRQQQQEAYRNSISSADRWSPQLNAASYSNTNQYSAFDTSYGPSREQHVAAQQYQSWSSPASTGYQNHADTTRQYNYDALNESAAPYQLDGSGQHHSSRLDYNSIPTATGYSPDCVEWVNSVLYLFYAQSHKYAPQIAESVYRSLNEKLSNITNSSPEYVDLMMEFTGVDRELSSPPELTNIRTETESDKSISVVCKVYLKRISLDLQIQQTRMSDHANRVIQHQDSLEPASQTHRYELVLENLEGKLKTMAMLVDKLIVIQFLDKPDTKISLRPRYSMSGDSVQKCPVNEDVLVQLVLSSLTQVVIDLYFGDDPEFPQFTRSSQAHSNSLQSAYRNKLNALKGSASEIKRQIKQDFFGALTHHSSPDKERKVLIKILRAKNINYNQNVTCIMEMDQPYQQALTSTQQGSNPYWDEHFLFLVSEKSSELLLELWDSVNLSAISGQQEAEHNGHKRSKSMSQSITHSSSTKSANGSKSKWSKVDLTSGGKFLGLARVPIDDLRKNPVQTINLPLRQSRLAAGDSRRSVGGGQQLIVGSDMIEDAVGGELQVELLYLEHSSASTDGISTGTNQLQKSGSTNSLAQLASQKGDIVSVDRKLTSSGYVIETTRILKPVGAARPRSSQQKLLSASNRLEARNPSPVSMLSTEQSGDFDINLDEISSRATDVQTPTTDLDVSGSQRQERGRSRSRSRSLLRAIKRRFSFSRTRSRSVGESSRGEVKEQQQQPGTATTSNLDALSFESRSRASSEVSGVGLGGGRAKSVPTSRDPSEVPTIVINKGRLSDTASAFTFTHPKSQLVIECVEPRLNEDGTVSSGPKKGRLRYYAIPDDAANKRKWRRRGTKLHLFNEHQFVACHLAGSSTCHLCGRVFSRRPGKQGYKCRNCHLLSHKQCHVKVDHNCPYASKDGLKLEYIDADPPASLVQEQEAAAARGTSDPSAGYLQYQYGERVAKSPRLDSKTMSVDVDDR